MRAIILAAGAGTRLNPLTNGCPKCLLPAGQRLLVDRQIEALRGVGVEDIVLVVGYEGDQIRAHCDSSVRYVDNLDYLKTNSIYSLYLARRELDTDTFLFNCDILFHPEVLTRMLEAGHPNVIAVDSHQERVPHEMNVQFDCQDCVTAISKDLEPARAQAQSVQLVRFDAAGARAVRREVERLIQLEQKNDFPTSAYGPLIEAGLFYAVEAGDLPWAEVDSVEDYEQALQHVVPRLESSWKSNAEKRVRG